MIQLKNIHIGFKRKNKNKPLFSVADLYFDKPELVALIGSNGSGKTTFFNTLLGLHPLLSGEILFHNENLAMLSKEKRVKTISFVPSNFSGVNHLSVYDLIAMGRSPYTNIFNRLTEEDRFIVSDIIEQLRLTDYANKSTSDLSDGERQIAMIGKALAQKTEIMVLDEPTAFLDYKNRREILNLLKNIVQKERKLIFISSHDLELCFQYCGRIIAIDSNEKELLDFCLPFKKEELIKNIFFACE